MLLMSWQAKHLMTRTAKQQPIYLLAQALDVSEAWLMGQDVPIDRSIFEKFDLQCNTEQLANEVHLIELIQQQYGKAS